MATGVFGIVLKWCVFGKRICSYLAKGKFAAIEITIFSCNSFTKSTPLSGATSLPSKKACTYTLSKPCCLANSNKP